MDSLTDIEMGDAAHTAVKKNILKLTRGITVGDIPLLLYQEDFLNEETWQRLSNTVTDREKGDAMVRDVQKRVQVCPSMLKTLCQILSSEMATTEIAGMIHVSYEKQLKEKAANQGSNGLLKDLIDDLKACKRISQRQETLKNEEELIQNSIQRYLRTSLEETISVETIKKELNDLHQKEMLISPEMLCWATTECKKAVKIKQGTCTTLVLATTTPQQPPSLFSPDTLYHASLCSLAISEYRDEESIHRFFGESHHKLCEVSVCQENSSEKLDRYLIARNGDIIYIAFRSEAKLSQWLKKYNTFQIGIEKQAENIPEYFFLEQMLKQQRVILTGFSFGGMLACSVAAKLWSTALDPSLLQRNLCCITFGQPIISLPYVKKMAKHFPKLEETIHLVLNKEDIIPGLMHYHSIGCMLTGIQQVKNEPKPLESSVNEETAVTDFRGPFSSKFLEALGILQDMNVSYSKALNTKKLDAGQALSTLKKLLRQIISMLKEMKFREDTCGLMGRIHMMGIEGESGLVWKSQVPIKDAVVLLLNLEAHLIEKIDTTLFRKHNMESYRANTCQTFLNKYHSHEIPSPSSSPKRVQSVSILSPSIISVEFHMYPDLHIVVLLGENLWFCHKIKLGKKGVTIECPANVKRRSVQYEFPPSTKTEALADSPTVHVVVQSHFAPPVHGDIPTKQEPFFFTLKQKQLARHTPTELIQLAYYTAMLERPLLSSASPEEIPIMSKRFEAVKHYLEEAAKVVPLESVSFAIAYGDDDTALKCAKALQSSSLKLPPSSMMITGLGMARDRVCLGREYQKQAAEVTNLIPLPAVVSKLRTSVSSHSQSQPRFQRGQFADPGSIARPHRASHRRQQTYSDKVKAQSKGQVVSYETVVQVPVPIFTAQPTPLDRDAAMYMDRLYVEIVNKYRKQKQSMPILSSRSIEQFCPFSPRRQTSFDRKLKSPVQALKEAREELKTLVEELNNPSMRDVQSSIDINQKMLKEVKRIKQDVIKMCASLLAAFMEQQIQIPLLSTDIGTAKALSTTSPVAMGAWAFVSMDYGDIQNVLSSPEGQSLSFIIEVENYINNILQHNSNKESQSKENRKPKDLAYADKLGFLVSGIKMHPTVTCSTQYISYSLECQLKKLSEQLKFDNEISVYNLVDSWESTFKGNALSLVAKTHRPLIGRWLKWALLTHDLRDTMASYLCLGVIGISNSGKSLLVNSLFQTKAQVGSTQSKKTVVPFLYNLDGKVDNLDVVDFPGIDDKDSIPELASLLVNLAQVVICVVNYKSVSSDSLTQWLIRLEKEDIPVLVCLTHADLLCDDLREELKTEDGDYPSPHKLKLRIDLERKVTTDVLCDHHVPSRTLWYCCFNKQSSHLSLEELTSEVGIHTFNDVGEWLVTTIRDKLDQSEIATKLREFLGTKDIN